jgi:hypothetical protein
MSLRAASGGATRLSAAVLPAVLPANIQEAASDRRQCYYRRSSVRQAGVRDAARVPATVGDYDGGTGSEL